MNLTLLSSVGSAAIMVMSVQGTFCGMLGAILFEFVDVVADVRRRRHYRNLLPADQRGLEYLHKDAWFVDGMPIFENVTILAATVPLIGSDAICLSFPVTEPVCMSIIACSVFKSAGKVTFKLDDCLKVKDNFGTAPTLERAFSSAMDVTNISAEVVNFCRDNRVDENTATMAGVVTEELACNVLLHGVKSNDSCNSYVRVTLNRHLYIRIYDDNSKFDPRSEMIKIASEPARPGDEKIGLRLVKKITDRYGSFDYQNTAGIDTSIVELRCCT